MLCRKEEPVQALIFPSRNQRHIVGGPRTKLCDQFTPVLEYRLPDGYLGAIKIYNLFRPKFL